jgi:DNA polymerase-3 subunit gamma/tau
LLARFNPILWEDEPKAGKISPLVNSIEENLDELNFVDRDSDLDSGLIKDILKNALKLESDGLSGNIPIAQLRRAAWWGRLAPIGRGKMIVIENADRMQEEARNSLLKLLEEPPGRLYIVLTSPKPGSLPQTILSRLRPYRFVSRDAALESDVIRRVFRDEEAASLSRGIISYLDSFFPVSPEALEALAAFFAASAAFKAALLLKRQGRALPEEVVLLGKYSAPMAEAAGLGRPQGDPAAVAALIAEKASNFEMRQLFPRFLCCLLQLVATSRKQAPFLPPVSYNEKWKEFSNWAEAAVGTYNLRPALVLEKFFTDISRGIAGL